MSDDIFTDIITNEDYESVVSDPLQDNSENSFTTRTGTGKEQAGNVLKTDGSGISKMDRPTATENHRISSQNRCKSVEIEVSSSEIRDIYGSRAVAYVPDDNFRPSVGESSLPGPESLSGTTENRRSDHAQLASDSTPTNYYSRCSSVGKCGRHYDPKQDSDEKNGENSRIVRIGTEEQTRNVSGRGMEKIDRPVAMENHDASDQNRCEIPQSVEIKVFGNRSEKVANDDTKPPVDGSFFLGDMRPETSSDATEGLHRRKATEGRPDHSQLGSDSMTMNDSASYFSMKNGRRNYGNSSKTDLDIKDAIQEDNFEVLDSIEEGIEVMPDDKEYKRAQIEMVNLVSNNVDEKGESSTCTLFGALYNCFYTDSGSMANAAKENMQQSSDHQSSLLSNIIRKSNVHPGKDLLNRHEADRESRKATGGSCGSLEINTNQAVPRENCVQQGKSSACDLLTRNPVIETLGDAINCFGLTRRLKVMEMYLEEVRKRQRSKEVYKSDLKQFDKDIQKLSFQFHPDRVRNRGGSGKELAVAQKLQTALNTTRTVLKVLGDAFLKDIDTDHRYGFYTNLSITSLGNEEEIKSYIKEVVSKISYLSEIKQRDIIAEIRNFLQESRNCIEWYFKDKEKEFEESRILAMLHLKKCIKGFKKLLAEFDSVEKECISERKNNIALHIEKMAEKSFHLLNALKNVKSFVKSIPDGRCQFYRPPYNTDNYFVMPFACYMNVIVMCNVMFKNRQKQSLRRHLPSFQQESEIWFQSDILNVLNYPYLLASVYSGCKKFKEDIFKVLGDKSGDREEVRKEFSKALGQASHCLEETFQQEHYSTESFRSNLFMDEYLECMTMLADFRRKEEEMRRGIERIATRTQEVEEKFAEAMEEDEEETIRSKERLERSRLLREQGSASLAR